MSCHLERHTTRVGCTSQKLAWRFATRIMAEDLAEMLREAVFRRFGKAWARAQGIKFLSDNGPEYTSHRFRADDGADPVPIRPDGARSRTAWQRRSSGASRAPHVPGVPGDIRRGGAPSAGVDRTIKTGRYPHSTLEMRALSEFYAEWMVKKENLPIQILSGAAQHWRGTHTGQEP